MGLNSEVKVQMPMVFKQLNALGLLAISAIMAFALYAQLADNELPCPLCLIQRLGFAGVMLGLLLNTLHGPQPRFYSLAMLFAVFGAMAALRQVSLHVIPGTPYYGSAFFGFHFYTWAFICFTLIIVGLAIVSGFKDQYKPQHFQNKPNIAQHSWLIKISAAVAVIILLLNTVLTFAECGPHVCPDDPTEYWILQHIN
jgi:disulfide bond formation protein DsbB